jgi:outer membrane protein TolC
MLRKRVASIRRWKGTTWLVVALALCGCTRTDYRRRADGDVYEILAEKQDDPRWDLPRRPVEADPASRMADPDDPDAEPMPPDDPAAHQYMHWAYKLAGSRRWQRYCKADAIEDPAWREQLPRDADGKVVLSNDTIMPLALRNSREYQDQVENVYLAALALTLERFEFDVQWFGGNDSFFDHFGSGGAPTESNRLSTDSRLGFQRNLAAGGQLLVDFANRFVWEFAGDDVSMASSDLVFTLTQPLLRGAFRDVRMEPLTEAERAVLYAVRDFARFRRDFYVGIKTDFLSLLTRVQAIRNTEANLTSLERSLREHEAMAAAGVTPQIQVDQVFQSVQSTRLQLVSDRASLESALDQFKIRLGLPPELEVRLDESLLDRFVLNDPRLDDLAERAEALHLELLQPDQTPSREFLAQRYQRLLALYGELKEVLDEVQGELQQWNARLGERGADDTGQAPNQTEQVLAGELQIQREAAEILQAQYEELQTTLEEDVWDADAGLFALPTAPPEDAWQALQELAGNHLRPRITEVLVVQSRIRVYLVDLTPVNLKSQDAVRIAADNRLDLMNQRAQVVDAWRRVEVAANALEADLDVRFEGDIGTDPQRNNPVAFSSSNSRYRVGLQFDGPLNRRAERNIYRRSQIAYQRARRQYMAAEDGIGRQVRDELRNLDRDRLQFEITRQQLVAAVRQVEQAQINLRAAQQADSSVTQDVLGALNTLLQAKNQLIANWVRHETSRMNLYRDLDVMQIDAEGVWTNEHERPGTP